MAFSHEHSKVTPLVILSLFGIFVLLAMLGSMITNQQSRTVDRSFAQIAGAHPTQTPTRTRTPTISCTQNGSCISGGVTTCCNGVRVYYPDCQSDYACVPSTITPTRTRTPTRTPTIFRATCNQDSPCQINETLQSSTCEGTSFCPTYWRSFSNCEPPYEGCNRMSYSYDAPCQPDSANCPNGVRCNDSDKKCLFAPEGKKVRCVNQGTTDSYCLIY